MATYVCHFLMVAASLAMPFRSGSGQTLPPPAHRQLAREISQELIEINTVRDSGATRAAEALERRLKAGGFEARTYRSSAPNHTSRTWLSGSAAAEKPSRCSF